MFCTKCGASCEDHAKFCASCGNAMQPQEPQQPEKAPEKKQKGRPKVTKKESKSE